MSGMTLKKASAEAKLLLIGIPVAIWTLVPIYHLFLFAISPKQDAFSGQLNTITAPSAPALTAVGGDSSVTLSWSKTSLAGHYRVYCATATGGYDYTNPIYDLDNASASISLPFTVCVPAKGATPATNIVAAAKYYFVVRASNTAGESASSAEVNATTLPGPVSDLAAAPTTDPTLTLSVTLTFPPRLFASSSTWSSTLASPFPTSSRNRRSNASAG